MNRSVTMPYGNGTLTLVGIDDLIAGAADLDAALQGESASDSVILLSHSPDILGKASEAGIPLVLSGHTHGGQVRFPLLGTPTTATEVPLERPSGEIRAANTVLYINPGLGTSLLPIRFFARPEVTVLELRTARTEGERAGVDR